jgi:hypothetical protein
MLPRSKALRHGHCRGRTSSIGTDHGDDGIWIYGLAGSFITFKNVEIQSDRINLNTARMQRAILFDSICRAATGVNADGIGSRRSNSISPDAISRSNTRKSTVREPIKISADSPCAPRSPRWTCSKNPVTGDRIELHGEKISPRNQSALTQMGEEMNILFSTT